MVIPFAKCGVSSVRHTGLVIIAQVTNSRTSAVLDGREGCDSRRALPTRIRGHWRGEGRPAGALTFCPLDIGSKIGYNFCVEGVLLPLPVRPVEVSPRSQKVSLMLLPQCHSFPPSQSALMSIRGENCSIKPSPAPGKKRGQFHPPFPAQDLSLSRCVTKIRGLAAGARNHSKIHVIVNKAVIRFPRHEREKNAGTENEG